jgi:D-glycero-D-manno-heptose 1,7-bisphosphate phosphatase
MKKAAFLDRDGVINIDHAYVYRPEEFEFVDGVFEAAKALIQAGYELVIVTNQSGIGRGYYSEADFDHLCQWMKERFAEVGAPITDIYFCPHHPEKAIDAYRCACDCRKPAPGMILRAQKAHDYDLAASLMVGDKLSDMKAAANAGVGTRIQVGKDGKETPSLEAPATHVALNLREAVSIFLKDAQ